MDLRAVNTDEIDWLKVRLEAIRSFLVQERERGPHNDDLIAKFIRAEDRLRSALAAVDRVSQIVSHKS